MLRDVMEAVRRERHRLLASAPPFKPDQATAMLRVEYARDVAITLQSEMMSNDYQGIDRPHLHGREGPITVEGVAYYMVDRLPMPGWRVINPMKV